jgi:hypothetical protein
MKLKVTQSELNECFHNAIKRVLSEGKDKRKFGFKKNEENGPSHKSLKSNNRKPKYGTQEYFDDLDLYEAIETTDADDDTFDDDSNDSIEGLEGFIDLTSPDDNYVDDEEQDDVVYGGRSYEEDKKEEPMVTIKTDIDKVEQDLINDILEEFPESENDVVEGCIAFNVPTRLKKPFVEYLLNNDVNLIK